jgi:hypothetical protein
MFTTKKKTIVINDIAKTARRADNTGGNFLINGSLWVNYAALRNALLAKGLGHAVHLPFTLVGCKLTIEFIEVKPEHLTNGPVKYKAGNREIEFKQPGEKVINTSIDVTGSQLATAVASESAKFIASAASTPVAQPAPVQRQAVGEKTVEETPLQNPAIVEETVEEEVVEPQAQAHELGVTPDPNALTDL